MDNIDIEKLDLNRGNWQENFVRLVPQLDKLSLLNNGVIEQQKAEKWLKAASIFYSPSAINALISQNTGLTGENMRTLVAYERGEYHPNDSPAEIYERKKLNTITPPSDLDTKRRQLGHMLASEYIRQGLNLENDNDIAAKMMGATTGVDSRQLPWMIGKPTLVNKDGGTGVVSVFDVHITNQKYEGLRPNDAIVSHHHDLVINNYETSPTKLYVVKLEADNEYLDSLISTAELYGDSKELLSGIAKNLIKNQQDSKIKLSLELVTKNPELYKEIATIGNKHWNNLTTGVEPETRINAPSVMPDGLEKEYNELSKRLITAQAAARVAQEQFADAQQDIKRFMTQLPPFKNFVSPNNGVIIQSKSHVKHEKLAEHLQNTLGKSDPTIGNKIHKQEVDVDRLALEAQSAGIDVRQFMKKGDLDKDAVLKEAQEHGIDIERFEVVTHTPLTSPKTRNQVFETVNHIREEMREAISNSIDRLSKSPELDAEHMLATGKAVKKQQSMKI